MKTISCLLLLLCIASLSLAAPLASKNKLPPRGAGKDVLMFVEGFFVGLEVEVGNVTECAKDVSFTLESFVAGYKDLKNGIDHLDRSSITQGLVEWGAGLLSLVPVVEGCGVITLAEDIANIANEITKGPLGLVEIIVKEAVNIFYHGKDLTADFKLMISSFESGDYYDAGVATGEIVGILLAF